MKVSKLFLLLTVTCCLIVVTSSKPSLAASGLIPIYSPPAGGTAYMLVVGFVSVTNKYIQDLQDRKLVHESSRGSMDMMRRMMERAAQNKESFATPGLSDAYRAYKGEGEYGGKPFSDLRGVVFINGSDIYLMVPKNSPIKTYADAKGKRLGMNPTGSSVANTALFLLEKHGVSRQDFKPQFCSYRESVEGIQDGSLDGGFVGGGFPIASYVELSMSHDVRIVPVDEKVVEKAVREHPYYYRNVVKANSYKGIEQDVTIMGFTTGICTNAGASTDLIYKIVKNLFKHKDDYYAIHKSAKDMTPETAMKGFSIPMHPGAVKYYREIGIWKN